jgi:hypothetical protein
MVEEKKEDSNKKEDKQIQKKQERFVKSKVNEIKIKLKKFKKLCKKDMSESINIAKELKIDIKNLIKLTHSKNKIKLEDWNKILESLDLYITNANSIMEFRKKWD